MSLGEKPGLLSFFCVFFGYPLPFLRQPNQFSSLKSTTFRTRPSAPEATTRHKTRSGPGFEMPPLPLPPAQRIHPAQGGGGDLIRKKRKPDSDAPFRMPVHWGSQSWSENGLKKWLANGRKRPKCLIVADNGLKGPKSKNSKGPEMKVLAAHVLQQPRFGNFSRFSPIRMILL